MEGFEALQEFDRFSKMLDRWLPQETSGSSSAPADDLSWLTFEGIFRGALATGEDGGEPSPLQLAIIRSSRGLPVDDVLTAEQVVKHFGVADVGDETPTLVALICGVRGGKSKLGACRAIHGALTADLARVMGVELPRYAIIGPDVDTATATFRDLVGIVQADPRLEAMLAKEPTADTLVLRRPDRHLVEIKVVAAARGGRTVRNRWLLGLILEEVAQIGAEVTGAAVSAEAIWKAAKPRLLPGCQAWFISSPYGPQGLLYKLWQDHFGNPGQTLVVHADTRSLNPSYPQERIDEEYAKDPDNAAREFGAEWLDAESSFFNSLLVSRATRSAPLEAPREPGATCWAAGDFATRGNAWTVTVSTRAKGHGGKAIVKILAGWEWIGSKNEPLIPRTVLDEMAVLLKPYGVTKVTCDQWSFDALQGHARQAGLQLVEAPSGQTQAAYGSTKSLLASGDLELPPLAQIANDLRGVRKVATAGNVRIVLTKQANGRHCDFAPSVALCAALASEAKLSVYRLGTDNPGFI